MSVFIRTKVQDGRPSDSIEIRRDQVATFYEIVVDTWKPQKEIWALTYGPKILGVAGALSGWYGNLYFRKKLRLKNFGLFSTYLPNMALPFLLVSGFQTAYTQQNIYLDPYGCSICKGTRAAAIQIGFGLLQPLVLVPASAFMFATRHFTYRMPSPIHNPKEFFIFYKKLYKPLRGPMTINVCLQIMLAFFITHMQENHFLYLQKEMSKSNIDQIDDNDQIDTVEF